MNLLTFDIEEWYLERIKANRAEKLAEFDAYLDQILAKLDERKMRATFFCVGEMGRLFPEVIRKIDSVGHEIGCHSNIHTWLNKMTEAECREDTKAAVSSLEQCIGKKVLSYRAPAFSIGESNRWAFEILAENGIERDSSVYPAVRDFGGFADFGSQKPCLITQNGITLKEFPIPMVEIAGKKMAYSGGGYFRFFPLWFVKKTMKASDYVMTYFHINDLEHHPYKMMTKEEYESYFKQSGTFKNRFIRMVKHSLGSRGAFDKMCNLVCAFDYLNLEEADKMIEWGEAKIVEL